MKVKTFKTYIYKQDAYEISLQCPSGVSSRNQYIMTLTGSQYNQTSMTESESVNGGVDVAIIGDLEFGALLRFMAKVAEEHGLCKLTEPFTNDFKDPRYGHHFESFESKQLVFKD